MNSIEKWMLKNVQAPAGEYRDWETITAWAMAIADELQEPLAAQAMHPG